MQAEIETLGTARRKEGEGFEALVNATCAVKEPSPDDVTLLHQAEKTQHQMYLEQQLCTVSSIKVARSDDGGVRATFVLHNPAPGAVARLYELLRDGFMCDVQPAQAVMAST